jgi:ATP-dependent DNA helicase RecQ
MTTSSKTPEEFLQKTFGHKEFRPIQKDIIAACLDNHDVLVLMPTGGGKSLCYQLPGLMDFENKKKTTIIISPLRSLILDQVSYLKEKGIAAESITGEHSYLKNSDTCENMGKYAFIYTTPESLDMNQMLATSLKANTGNISRLVIDESHCVSTWGHDFRSSYLQLGRLREELFPGVPVTALTATASEVVQSDIVAQLRMKEEKRFISSFFRPNLHLWAFERPVLSKFVEQLQKIVKKHETGIIYCTTRAKCEQFSERLGLPYYHAGLSNEDRKRVQESWQRGDTNVLVATVAFGMGIDNSRVRFVVHANLPQSLEQYYQEIGRAGRDGSRADCYLFHSYSDKVVLQQMITKGSAQKDKTFLRHQTNCLLDMYRFANDSVRCKHQMVCKTFNETIGPCRKSCQSCITPDLTKTVDITEISKEVFHLLIREPQSRAQLRRRLKKVCGFIDDVLIHLILEKFVKEEVVPNSSGFWTEQLKLYKKARTILDGKKTVSMEVVKNQRGLFNKMQLKISVGTKKAENTLKPSKMAYSQTDVNRYNKLRQELMSNKPPQNNTTNNVQSSDKLYESLVALRQKLAQERKCPVYVVFPNKTLREIADTCPTSREDMLQIKGIGKVKCERYAEPFLKAVNKHTSSC